MLWTLTKLLRRPDLTHAGIAFDRTAPPKKGDRSDGALLRGQNALVGDIARALGIAVWPMVRLQADDALATAAARWGDAVERAVICTRDRDLYQCIRGERVVVLDRVQDRVADEAALLEKYGVRPEQVPEVHALVGDPSDGLPGIEGWGPRSTATVLSAYDRIEDIPDDASAWTVRVRGAARLAARLAERRDEALLFRNLATLRTDVPLPQELDALAWRGADRTQVEALAKRLGAREVLEKIRIWR